MKLGSQTNSLVNHLYSRMTIGAPAPVAGMPATILHWTDRSPATVFRVFTVGKAVIVELRDDDYTRTDTNGLSESQQYDYKTNVNGSRRYFRQNADGAWQAVFKNPETGRWNKTNGSGLILGRRECYYDPSF